MKSYHIITLTGVSTFDKCNICHEELFS